MKPVLSLLALILISLSSFAQQSNRTTIQFRLSDGQPMVLTINDREFKKVNNKITVYDLPRKRHTVRVYRFRPFADGKGGKAELVYSGRFKVNPGSTYDAIVDVNKRKLLIKDLGITSVNSRPDVSGGYMPPPPAQAPNPKNDVAIGSTMSNANPDLNRLQQDMLSIKEDSKKLEKAKQYINANSINTTDLRTVSSWIMFDDNKLNLLKQAYSNVSDKDNYENLYDVFTMPDAQNSFKQYVKTLK